MVMVNLNTDGRDVSIDIPGKVIEKGGKPPLIVLLAENHEDNNVKSQNLRIACKLIDELVVDLVTVEERFDGDANAQIEAEVKQLHKVPSLKTYSDGLLADLGEDGVLSGIKTCGFRVSFAKYLLYLRPTIRIASVEDLELVAKADGESQVVAQEFKDEADPESRRKKQIAKFRGLQVHRDREEEFVKRLFAARVKFGSKLGIILNAGGFHHKHIAKRFDQEHQSYLLIYPEGYMDALT